MVRPLLIPVPKKAPREELGADCRAGLMAANLRPPLVPDYHHKKTNIAPVENILPPAGCSVRSPPKKRIATCHRETLRMRQNRPTNR